MTLVRILWAYNDWPLLDQTRGGSGRWDEVSFTTHPVETCDYAIIVNYVHQTARVTCPPANVWMLTMEPPVPEYRFLRQGNPHYGRVFTQDMTLTGPKFVHSHGALPWYIGRSYDELCAETPPSKSRDLSWVTSDDRMRTGQQARMDFLDTLRANLDFDLWGKGFRWIDRKWDALAPFRYTLAIENYRGPHYWTEKIADAFLAWTMPIYYGASNITDYFPEEAVAIIDISEPQVAAEQVREIIASNRFEHNKDAIAYARELVLEKYQFFPFLVEHIHQCESATLSTAPQPITLPVLASPAERRQRRPINRLRRLLWKIKRKLVDG